MGKILMMSCLMSEEKLSPFGVTFCSVSKDEEEGREYLGLTTIPAEKIINFLKPKTLSDHMMLSFCRSRGISTDALKDAQQQLIPEFLKANISQVNSLPTMGDLWEDFEQIQKRKADDKGVPISSRRAVVVPSV